MTVTDLKFMPKFYDRYIGLVNKNHTIKEALEHTMPLFKDYISNLTTYENYRYQPEKWTPKDILQHVIDTERILAYRALSIARLEPNNLMGFNENAYAKHAKAQQRSITGLLEEFSWVRQSTLGLFNSFDNKTLDDIGQCSNIDISVLALGFTIVGHPIHHLNILKERYFDPNYVV